jgi:polyisoprenoid-binding protein YceI
MKRWWWLYLTGAVAGSLALTYLLLFTPDSQAELSLSDKRAAPVDANHLSGSWSPTGGSVAGYRVREKLATLPAARDAVGRTSGVTGSVQIRDDGSTIRALSGSKVEVDMSSIQSDESRRDDRMRTFALQTDTFPTATFTLTKGVVVPSRIRKGGTVSVQATGELTLHGVTQSVTIPLEMRLSGDTVQIQGSLDVNMADYHIDVSSFGGFVSIEDHGTMEFILSLQH